MRVQLCAGQPGGEGVARRLDRGQHRRRGFAEIIDPRRLAAPDMIAVANRHHDDVDRVIGPPGDAERPGERPSFNLCVDLHRDYPTAAVRWSSIAPDPVASGSKHGIPSCAETARR